MKAVFAFGLAGLSAAVTAAPLDDRSDYAVHSSHFVPGGWEQSGKPDPEHTINLRIGLKQGSFADLERHLYEVSDPNHYRYGQHLSAEEIRAFTAPSEEALSAVEDWLQSHGIFKEQVEYSPAKDWAVIALPVKQVEKLLDTEYHQYQDGKGAQVVRTTAYSLPRSLHGHIDTVQPTNYWGKPELHSSDLKIVDLSATNKIASLAVQAAPAACSGTSVSLNCVRTVYNTTDYIPKVPQKNYAAWTNYLGEVPSDSDFHQYIAQQRPDANQSYAFTRTIIANASNDQTNPGVEANLDSQALGGFIVPTKLTTYSTGGSPPFTPDISTPTNTNEPYLTWLDYVLKQSNLPYVISTSYGDDEQTVPLNYAQRVCAEFAQLGARGITLLLSSGDNGVGAPNTCLSNDGKSTPKFLPAFPASCPYITAVGGTRDFSPEQVAFDTSNGYVAGSGFSEYFSRPDYQAPQVKKYLASIGGLNKGLYNPNGRAYPDISAQSYRFQVVYKGRTVAVDGTSVASPISAGVLTLVNDALMAAGKPPLGFLNPLLYSSNGAGYTDVTVGNSTGCNTGGFPSGEGWDVASGFGTPNFKAIRAALGV
ncbi:uncharacterized protein MYCFIDRAFT_57642 [Pseudocercospora fijiensis CIRAD86]|uniref:tripeptidyl-peptidase II n=1 Tax=Pseudocercospora fijiensis (strain CIRAD86) TaxID=383855 RepID=M3APJ4_PSEFD|nr:uncharacterized protein MYCFIDRAFT_57642 [Pseudocercospora fijiensis CIRAD86]EME79352.1 hypothetical protein MYCFIDRAFT_57642 [Pseudocercospora fijiensis CIRAD86]